MKPNIEALEQLKRVVVDRPSELFDMTEVARKTTCGTATCAAGSAAIDPWFLKNTRIGEVIPFQIEGDEAIRLTDSFDMAELGEIFGIDEDYASELFNDDCLGGVRKSSVIANIDRIIAGKDPLPYYGDDRDEHDDDGD